MKGHYPSWVLARLIMIDKLKKQGASNDYISSKINTRNKLQTLYAKVSTQQFRVKLFSYGIIAVLVLILLNELDLVLLSKSKTQARMNFSEGMTTTRIIDSGTSFVPA